MQRTADLPRTFLLVSACVGVALSVSLRFLEGPGSDAISRVLTLAVLGVVPLTLAAAPLSGVPRLATLAAYAQPLCGAAVVVALAKPVSPEAGAWAAAWVGFSLLVAITGATLVLRGGLRRPETLATGAALAYLPVGAGWLVLSRLGLRPLDFDPLIVVLTAVHFHFAALAAPVLAVRVGLALDGVKRRVALGAALATAAAPPLVAVGIAWAPWLALVGAVVLAASLLTIATLTLGWAWRRLRSRVAKPLLLISGVSLLLSMPLAVLYAWGEATGETVIGIQWMLRTHGYANAHGFVVCGLFAWVLEDRLLENRRVYSSDASV